jgi:hypothetical protein
MAATELHIGVDFDNTIVCYNEVFYRLALEQELIPPQLSPNKTSIRDYLRSAGREDRWTAMQAVVYGERMSDARPFPGVLDFFAGCAERAVTVSIISHRTRQPIVGEPCDLHAAAFRWLKENRLVDFVPLAAISFHETRQGKVTQVREARCTHFIDDLPEFLAEAHLPPTLCRILFDPAQAIRSRPDLTVAASWAEIRKILEL